MQFRITSTSFRIRRKRQVRKTRDGKARQTETKGRHGFCLVKQWSNRGEFDLWRRWAPSLIFSWCKSLNQHSCAASITIKKKTQTSHWQHTSARKKLKISHAMHFSSSSLTELIDSGWVTDPRTTHWCDINLKWFFFHGLADLLIRVMTGTYSVVSQYFAGTGAWGSGLGEYIHKLKIAFSPHNNTLQSFSCLSGSTGKTTPWSETVSISTMNCGNANSVCLLSFWKPYCARLLMFLMHVSLTKPSFVQEMYNASPLPPPQKWRYEVWRIRWWCQHCGIWRCLTLADRHVW